MDDTPDHITFRHIYYYIIIISIIIVIIVIITIIIIIYKTLNKLLPVLLFANIRNKEYEIDKASRSHPN